MTSSSSRYRVAVIGAGIAGASCAQALARAGCAVHVVDKARGPGGRLASRRLQWLDAQGQPRLVKLDHGTPGFRVQDPGFSRYLAENLPAGTLAQWTPRLAAGSRPLDDAGALSLPLPDMPALCRALLKDLPQTWSFAVDRLLPGPQGWQLEAAGTLLPGRFDAVLLALPPAQAASLLAEHRRDWAQRAALALMQPCWTLMGVARRPARGLDWDLARPDQGPLAAVLRHDARPGRSAPADEAHWVLHARAGWSREHLEQPADWVQAQLHAALQDCLGEPVDWLHATVHRWRYAVPQRTAASPAPPCWWDPARGLGVCGDFLGGRGALDARAVEGAWLSAQALVAALPGHMPTPIPCAVHGPAH